MKGNFSKYRQKDKKNTPSEPFGKFLSDSMTLDCGGMGGCGRGRSRVLSDSGIVGGGRIVHQHWTISRVYYDIG